MLCTRNSIVSSGHQRGLPSYACSNSGSDGRLDMVTLGVILVVVCSDIVKVQEV